MNAEPNTCAGLDWPCALSNGHTGPHQPRLGPLRVGHRVVLGESKVEGTVKVVTPKRIDVQWDSAPLKAISHYPGQRIVMSYRPQELTRVVAIGDRDRYDLPDGSVMEVEWFRGSVGIPSALISRTVEGEVMWGQAFGGDRVQESVGDCLVKMRANPGAFLSANRRGV